MMFPKNNTTKLIRCTYLLMLLHSGQTAQNWWPWIGPDCICMEHNCHANQQHRMGCGPAQLETSGPETWIPPDSPSHLCLHTMPQDIRNPGGWQDHLLLKIKIHTQYKSIYEPNLGNYFLNSIADWQIKGKCHI